MLTRRDALRAGLAAGTALAVGGGGGCGEEGSGSLTLAVFEPTPTAALVSVAGYPGESVELTLGLALSESSSAQTVTLDDRGLARVEILGLAPATAYLLRADSPAGLTPWHRFSTLPPATARAPFSLVLTADIDPDPQFGSAIGDTMAASGADAFLCLGDWPYADNPPGAVTLDEYHARHREAREYQAIARVVQAMPTFAIYDDHEARNNWDRATFEREPARHLAAMQAWDDWFPLWLPRTGDRRYRQIALGGLADLFILDTRRHRAANADPDGPDKSMLGASQRAWLLEALTASVAPFKLIVTTVPLDHGMPEDHWAAFQFERAVIFEHLRATPITGVLFLSADQHWFAAHEHAFAIREFQVGPFARGIPVLPDAGPGVLARAAEYNFGRIDLGEDLEGPHLVFTAHGADGRELYRERLTPEALTPAG